MRMILGALALVLAVPAVAQEAPATDPHAEHRVQGQEATATNPPEHREQGHGQQQRHQGHAGHGEHMMDCCDKMKPQGQSMKCCDKHGEDAGEVPADHSQHDN